MNQNRNCDGSGPHAAGVVKKMPQGGGANSILCRRCWSAELNYRRSRNISLEDFAKYDLPAWETAEVYEC